MFDGVFENLVLEKNNNGGPVKVVNAARGNIRSIDPRPDLTQDTILWQQFLAGARDTDHRYGDPEQKLYSALLYMRARGTSLQRTPSGRLALRPYIDSAGNDAWTNQDEYDREKVKVLRPVEGRLIELLGKMAA